MTFQRGKWVERKFNCTAFLAAVIAVGCAVGVVVMLILGVRHALSN